MPTPTFDILAVTNFGLEAVASRELSQLGYDAKGAGTGRVHFQGDALAIARANLWLRSADRVLIRVASFPCRDFDTLFEQTKSIAWEEWIPPDFAFPVNGRSVRSQLTSVPACQRTVKKAIVERLMSGHRVSTLPETGPPVTIEISILHDVATITLDTSGQGLHKRGYRPIVGEAALKETLAAGLVLLSVWRPDRPLIDPFCGTGTIAIEAAMIARNLAPGLFREFEAEHWPALGPDVWQHAREEAKAAPARDLAFAIHASDIDERALAIARKSAALAGVERDIHFAKRDFAELSSKAEYGCIITNPPYGVRLGDEAEIDRLYRSMPLVLRVLPTWSFHIFTARLDLEAIFGQQATRRRKFYNSKIECWYFTFLGPKPERAKNEQREDDALISDPDEHKVAPALTPELSDSEAPGTNAQADPDLQGLTSGVEDPPSEVRRLSEPTLPSDVRRLSEPTLPSDVRRLSEPTLPSDVRRLSEPTLPSDVRRLSEPTLPSDVRRLSEPTPAAFGGLRERDEREARDFGACLAKNLRHLRRYPSRGITCYRVYERDVVDVPLIIDLYEGRAHVAEYEREHSRSAAQQADWWDLMRSTIAREAGIPPALVFTKEKHRQRGLTQHEKQDESNQTFVVQEANLKFEVNLSDYIDTGLFLDHRLTRAMVRDESRAKRLLNLFCYTGSFTVYAAAGGATSTTSVDLSNTYLEWAQRNLALNNFWPGPHRLVRSDVREFLATHPPGQHYDLAVIDPPTFSNSKATKEDWEVAAQHAEVLELTSRLLSPGGVVYFSTNYRRFKLDEDRIAAAGFTTREISRRTVPPEYRNDRIHRCWRLVKNAIP
ncbi:MAG: class I SAM-dependent methyltransferase [Phycisphaerales bacterium]|jgi:23S rRNA (guanine2445-N2)-methyltransferase / 23S rRNA (guanine2069-N7)-methyltransferase